MAAPSPKASRRAASSRRADVDDIHVAVEQQCPTAAATAEAPDELRPGPPPRETSGPLQLRRVEMRTVAGPASVVQWVLSGGPYTVWSHVRQVHVVCPPPWPRP